MSRTRTITWHDPMEGAKEAMQMDGIDYLQAMSDEKFSMPPLLHTLDFTVTLIEKGNVVFEFVPQEFHYNPIGTVHGGIISAILDSAMGCSVHSLLPAGKGYSTLELKVNFLKAITIKTGKLKTMGKVINLGGRTALVEAQLVDENNTIYAHAVSTCLILNF
ncbi:aromatic compound degradation protein PaaI [Pedobacter sp. Leaf216]|uniref:PaaI family thioesterase n=1 Tax=Pedobacter sp. Leaf216 TaxID=1735684 RepID=UPI000701F2CF|nr:PaaI family thioesterase [Pedobacter sp. Leaf216]KQM66004.1 aromatic compound degradation protein PaaI [Pedobacter sp. Leaf216]